jgi:uncharacterized protein (TIGR03435 family)
MMNRIYSAAAVAALFAAIEIGVSAQSTAPRSSSGAAFDVVSIKRNPSGSTEQSVNVTPTGVIFINFALRPIIQLTYGIPQAARLIGMPDWVNDRYDVIARTETPVSPATIIAMRPMLQAMFVDRFKLAAKLEKRALPAYALVLARSDGRLGPQLKRSTAVCAGRGAAPPDVQANGPQTPVPCGPRPGGPGRFLFVGSPISLFASVLALPMGRTVVDRTGLEGLYDLDVMIAPVGPGAGPSDAPSLFTALQEQLGLRLDPEQELVEVLVVDRIERPTEN